MGNNELLEKIAFNVIQGRVEAEDEGFDEGLEGQPAVTELVEEALHHGPQYVTRRGKDAVVIVSVKEYEALTSHKPTFKEFLLSCPTLDEPLDIERSQELPRSIEL